MSGGIPGREHWLASIQYTRSETHTSRQRKNVAESIRAHSVWRHHLLCDVMMSWQQANCSGKAAQQQQYTIYDVSTEVKGQPVMQTKTRMDSTTFVRLSPPPLGRYSFKSIHCLFYSATKIQSWHINESTLIETGEFRLAIMHSENGHGLRFFPCVLYRQRRTC